MKSSMLRMPTARFIAGVGLLVSSCDTQSGLRPVPASPPGYSYSYAVADCAPWDGPAVTLYLTATPTDSTTLPAQYLRVSVYRGADALAGNTFAWPSDTQIAGATRCSASSNCEAATSGRITFRSLEPGGALSGSIDLSFADGTGVRGGFRSAWRNTRALCG